MAKAIKCSRCARRHRNQSDWNVVMSSGLRTWFLCPGCQTPEENSEAEINLATTNYARRADGRVIGFMKGDGAE